MRGSVVDLNASLESQYKEKRNSKRNSRGNKKSIGGGNNRKSKANSIIPRLSQKMLNSCSDKELD